MHFRTLTISAEFFYIASFINSFANSRFVYSLFNPIYSVLVPYFYYFKSYSVTVVHRMNLRLFFLNTFISAFSAVNALFFRIFKKKFAFNFRFLLFFKYFLKMFFTFLNLIVSSGIFITVLTLLQEFFIYCISVCLYLVSLLIKFNTSILEFARSLLVYIWFILSKTAAAIYFAFLYTIRFLCIRLLALFSNRLFYLLIIFIVLYVSKDGFYLLFSIGDFYIS